MGDHHLEGTVVVSTVSELDDGTFATIKFNPGTHLVEGQRLGFLKPPNYPPNPFNPVYFTAQNSGTIVEILVEQEQEIKFLQPLVTYESELADNELDSDIEAELLAEIGMCGSQIPWD